MRISKSLLNQLRTKAAQGCSAADAISELALPFFYSRALVAGANWLSAHEGLFGGKAPKAVFLEVHDAVEPLQYALDFIRANKQVEAARFLGIPGFENTLESVPEIEVGFIAGVKHYSLGPNNLFAQNVRATEDVAKLRSTRARLKAEPVIDTVPAKILKAITERGAPVSAAELTSLLGVTLGRVRNRLGKLRNARAVELVFSPEGTQEYMITGAVLPEGYTRYKVVTRERKLTSSAKSRASVYLTALADQNKPLTIADIVALVNSHGHTARTAMYTHLRKGNVLKLHKEGAKEPYFMVATAPVPEGFTIAEAITNRHPADKETIVMSTQVSTIYDSGVVRVKQSRISLLELEQILADAKTKGIKSYELQN